MIKTHKDLDVWQRSIKFVTDIYQLTSQFPQEEKFGLVSQLRRSAISIPSNIAEGSARKGKTEFRQFLYIALSSAAELDTQLIIANNLGFVKEDFDTIVKELNTISRMLQGLIKSLNN